MIHDSSKESHTEAANRSMPRIRREGIGAVLSCRATCCFSTPARCKPLWAQALACG